MEYYEVVVTVVMTAVRSSDMAVFANSQYVWSSTMRMQTKVPK